MAYIGLERTIAKLEYDLSRGASIPILGSLIGAAKVILGIIQTIGALLALIGSIPFLPTEWGREFGRRAGSHVVNGMANIAAGALEAIPLVGTVIGYIRSIRVVGGCGDDRRRVNTDQVHAILVGYRILEDNALNSDDNVRISPLLVV